MYLKIQESQLQASILLILHFPFFGAKIDYPFSKLVLMDSKFLSALASYNRLSLWKVSVRKRVSVCESECKTE